MPTEHEHAFVPASGSTVVEVLRRLISYIEKQSDPGELEAWASTVNGWLDGVADQDGFGTEGQCDPRGQKSWR